MISKPSGISSDTTWALADTEPKKVIIAGAGAVGSYYGALLQKDGHDVRFLARGAHLDAIREKGLTIRDTYRNWDLNFPIHTIDAAWSQANQSLADLVLLTSKTYDTAGILDQVAPFIGPHTLLLSLQNGVESESIMADRFGAHGVLGGLCYVSAQMPAPGVIVQAIPGMLLFGELDRAETERSKALSSVFTRAGINNKISSDISKDMWEKFAWNVPFNQMAAVGDLNVGELLDVPVFREGIRGAMSEVVDIATAHGVALSPDLFERHIALSEKNRSVIPSLLQDARKGKTMEHDTFGGFVAREGRKHGIPTPYNDRLFRFLNRPLAQMHRSPAALNGLVASAKRALSFK